jgi:hypothetical protein
LTEGAAFTGVDLGLTDFAVTSKRQHFQSPRHNLSILPVDEGL